MEASVNTSRLTVEQEWRLNQLLDKKYGRKLLAEQLRLEFGIDVPESEIARVIDYRRKKKGVNTEAQNHLRKRRQSHDDRTCRCCPPFLRR